ncbi:MAG: YceD family protein [Deinococcus sp.]|nr:YceD family protein [Deinococcus sp.]
MTTLPEIHLGQLLRTSQDAHAEGQVTELRYEQGGEQVLTFAGPAPYRVDINSVGGDDFYLQGYFRPTLQTECARCLRPVKLPLDLKLGTLMRFDPAVDTPHIEEAESGEELLMFGEPLLDLSGFLAETALISVPLVVLHSPDCKGLCQVCGQDLNEGTCEHAAAVQIEAEEAAAQKRDDANNPFAALRGLNLPDEDVRRSED